MAGYKETSIEGLKFNFLTAICRVSCKKGIKYLFKCDCGNSCIMCKWKVVSGRNKSCGCKNHLLQSKAITTHNMSRSSEYKTYSAAKNRCINKNDSRYKDYGGRGIKFLFNSFEEFFKELGPRPLGKSLDRINNNGHYESGNCRWATSREQAFNRRNNNEWNQGILSSK